jgi:hypothetical protein
VWWSELLSFFYDISLSRKKKNSFDKLSQKRKSSDDNANNPFKEKSFDDNDSEVALLRFFFIDKNIKILVLVL